MHTMLAWCSFLLFLYLPSVGDPCKKSDRSVFLCAQAVNGGSPTWFGSQMPIADIKTLAVIVSDCKDLIILAAAFRIRKDVIAVCLDAFSNFMIT